MIWTIAIIFLLLWVIGLITSYTLGGYIHLLVGVAVVMLLVRIVRGPGHKTKDWLRREKDQESIPGKSNETSIYPEKRRTQ